MIRVLFALTLILASYIQLGSSISGDKLIVCYVTNWSQYRPEGGKFIPEDIDPNLCTHIIYAFAKLNGYNLEPYEWNDESTAWSKGLYERTIDLKKQNPKLKVLIGVGGWNHGSGPFSIMVHSEKLRKKFVQSAVKFLKRTGFDGLDLDWEYPGTRSGSRPSDKRLFTVLISELKEAFKPNNYLLTAAVAAGKSNIDNGYEIDKITKILDFTNIMAYDFHGSWDKTTGHNSPLYSRVDEYGEAKYLNIDWAVNYWLRKGADKDKLVIGLANYGRSFHLVSSFGNRLGSSVTSSGSPGTYTREAGFLSYYEVCDKLKEGWTKEWDDDHQVPFAYSDTEWIGYDDVDSIKIKANYILDKDLGGVMFWALDCDDFSGTHCNQGKFPLVNAAKNVFISRLGKNSNNLTPEDQNLNTKESDEDDDSSEEATTNAYENDEEATTTSINMIKTTETIATTPISIQIDPTTAITPVLENSPLNILKSDQPNTQLDNSGYQIVIQSSLNQDSNPDSSQSILNILKVLEQLSKTLPTTSKTTFYTKNNQIYERLRKLLDSDLFNHKNYILMPGPNGAVTTSNLPTITTPKSVILDMIQSNNLESHDSFSEPTLTTPGPVNQEPVKVPTEADLIRSRLIQAFINGFRDKYNCARDGLYSDRSSGCIIFHECIWTNTQHATRVKRVCPEGTIFNQRYLVCDWQTKTSC